MHRTSRYSISRTLPAARRERTHPFPGGGAGPAGIRRDRRAGRQPPAAAVLLSPCPKMTCCSSSTTMTLPAAPSPTRSAPSAASPPSPSAPTGTLVYWDQWEDGGYDADIANPGANVYASPGNPDGTQIWGDGVLANGCPPSINNVPNPCTVAADDQLRGRRRDHPGQRRDRRGHDPGPVLAQRRADLLRRPRQVRRHLPGGRDARRLPALSRLGDGRRHRGARHRPLGHELRGAAG